MNQPLTTSSLSVCADLSTGERRATCDTHGEFISHMVSPGFPEAGLKPIWSHCPTCKAENEAYWAERNRREAESQKARKIADLFHYCGIPPRFQDRTLENYIAETAGQKKALAMAKRYVENWPTHAPRGTSLVLSGGPGTGKTHIACAIASALINAHQVSCVFLTVTAALRSIKETYAKDSQTSEQQAINNLLEPDLLILDEIGVQTGSEHEKQLMFEVLNDRYQYLRPTILLSNLSRADLEAFLGQRVMDRYAECGAVIAFDWQSHRGRK